MNSISVLRLGGGVPPTAEGVRSTRRSEVRTARRIAEDKEPHSCGLLLQAICMKWIKEAL